MKQREIKRREHPHPGNGHLAKRPRIAPIRLGEPRTGPRLHDDKGGLERVHPLTSLPEYTGRRQDPGGFLKREGRPPSKEVYIR